MFRGPFSGLDVAPAPRYNRAFLLQTHSEKGVQMAHHASAKKRIRQTERRTEINRTRLSAVRTSIRKVESAIEGGDQAAAKEALKQAEPLIARSAQKGVLHTSMASRKLSRLVKRIKGMAA